MNFNHQSSAPSGPRSYRGNGGANNGTGNANNGNPNYKGKNFNPNYKGKNYNPKFTRPVPANNDTGNSNGTGNSNNGNPNYKGKKFNPNYKGKNYNQNFTRPVPADIVSTPIPRIIPLRIDDLILTIYCRLRLEMAIGDVNPTTTIGVSRASSTTSTFRWLRHHQMSQ